MATSTEAERGDDVEAGGVAEREEVSSAAADVSTASAGGWTPDGEAAPVGTSTGFSVPIPVLRVGMRRLRLPMPGARFGQQAAWAGGVAAAASPVPLKELALFAGLGAAAAFSVIEWPVAVAVAAGTEIARRAARSGGPRTDIGDSPTSKGVTGLI